MIYLRKPWYLGACWPKTSPAVRGVGSLGYAQLALSAIGLGLSASKMFGGGGGGGGGIRFAPQTMSFAPQTIDQTAVQDPTATVNVGPTSPVFTVLPGGAGSLCIAQAPPIILQQLGIVQGAQETQAGAQSQGGSGVVRTNQELSQSLTMTMAPIINAPVNCYSISTMVSGSPKPTAEAGAPGTPIGMLDTHGVTEEGPLSVDVVLPAHIVAAMDPQTQRILGALSADVVIPAGTPFAAGTILPPGTILEHPATPPASSAMPLLAVAGLWLLNR